MRRRTFLPYRQGLLLGCLGFAPKSYGAVNGLARGFNAAVNVSSSSSSRKIPSVAPAPKRPKKNVLLFYCEEMRELAEHVVLESDSIELRSISWRFTLPRRRKLYDQVCTGAKKSEELSKLAARKLSNSFNLNTKGTQMRRLVAPYKKIRKVVFLEYIPRSPSGKILRRVLKATASNQQKLEVSARL